MLIMTSSGAIELSEDATSAYAIPQRPSPISASDPSQIASLIERIHSRDRDAAMSYHRKSYGLHEMGEGPRDRMRKAAAHMRNASRNAIAQGLAAAKSGEGAESAEIAIAGSADAAVADAAHVAKGQTGSKSPVIKLSYGMTTSWDEATPSDARASVSRYVPESFAGEDIDDLVAQCVAEYSRDVDVVDAAYAYGRELLAEEANDLLAQRSGEVLSEVEYEQLAPLVDEAVEEFYDGLPEDEECESVDSACAGEIADGGVADIVADSDSQAPVSDVAIPVSAPAAPTADIDAMTAAMEMLADDDDDGVANVLVDGDDADDVMDSAESGSAPADEIAQDRAPSYPATSPVIHLLIERVSKDASVSDSAAAEMPADDAFAPASGSVAAGALVTGSGANVPKDPYSPDGGDDGDEEVFEVDGTNFYLSELGIPREAQVQSFASRDDERYESWMLQRKVFGQDETELWSLDTTFLQWMYCHLRMFKDVGGCIGHEEKISFAGKEMSLEKAVSKLIRWCGNAILLQYNYSDPSNAERFNKELTRVFALWSVVLPHLWF